MNEEPGFEHPVQRTPGSAAGGRVVVGVDGSAGSRDALVRALVEATQRSADVEVVATYPLPFPWAGGSSAVVPDPAALRERLTAAVAPLVDDARRDAATLAAPDGHVPEVRTSVSEGPAGPVLIERSRGADLLVVGSRGRGALRSAVLGSVALHCAAGAACPVLVVPPGRARPAGAPVVVVGIDGSASARAALRVAVLEARRSGAAVEAVAAYDSGGRWTELDERVAPSFAGIPADVEHGAAALVDEVLAELRAEGPEPVPEVRPVVVEGSPAQVLVDRSHEAALLVVGNRGHGGVRGLLLGSVTLRCLVSAACPVLVVHDRSDRPAQDAGRAAAAAVPS